MRAVSETMSSTPFPDLFINASDVENMTLNEYEHWYRTQGQQLSISGYNITACSLEEELKQVQNTTRCFIFSESESEWALLARYVYTYEEFYIVTEAPQFNRKTETGHRQQKNNIQI